MRPPGASTPPVLSQTLDKTPSRPRPLSHQGTEVMLDAGHGHTGASVRGGPPRVRVSVSRWLRPQCPLRLLWGARRLPELLVSTPRFRLQDPSLLDGRVTFLHVPGGTVVSRQGDQVRERPWSEGSVTGAGILGPAHPLQRRRQAQVTQASAQGELGRVGCGTWSTAGACRRLQAS